MGDVVRVVAKIGVSRDPWSFGAVSRTILAPPYWNQRILFRAKVEVAGLSGESEARLFVRVMGDGSLSQGRGYRTLVFDNMHNRGHKGSPGYNGWRTVIVDVPPPPPVPEDLCPEFVDPETVPTFIHFGVILTGGTGGVKVEQVLFQAVGKDFPLTSVGTGPSSWWPPGPRDLDPKGGFDHR